MMRYLVPLLLLTLPALPACRPTMRCVNDDGTSIACDSGPRCRHWDCYGGAVCCPQSHPYGCAEGLCGASEAACGALLCGDDCPACPDPIYPVPCLVVRPEGLVETCAESVAACEAVPGEVCGGSLP